MSEKETRSRETPEEEQQEQTAAEVQAEGTETAEKTETVAPEQKKLEELEQELAREKDKYLRLAAEYDNYRKRTVKEKENLYNDGKMDAVSPILEVYDNLERGLAQCEPDSAHHQGMEMIIKQFLDTLGKMGITRMESLHQPFDPERHNAVMHAEEEGAGENTVAEVFQEGFLLGERVLRFATVKVVN